MTKIKEHFTLKTTTCIKCSRNVFLEYEQETPIYMRSMHIIPALVARDNIE